MKRVSLFVLPLAIAGVFLCWISGKPPRAVVWLTARERSSASARSADRPKSGHTAAFGPRPAPRVAPLPQPASPAERIKRVNDDYDQLTLAVLGGLGAGAGGTAGPSDTMLRQLALLERERRQDIAKVLGPGEFEAMELKESPAGRLVGRAFEGTSASDEQRREVFRVQRDLELQLGQAIDATPLSFLQREEARQAAQEGIRAVLGEELFGVWRAAADDLYANAARLAQQSGASPRMADDLVRARDDYNLQVLTLRATAGLGPTERRAAKSRLTAQARARAAEILGLQLYQSAGADLLTWLPPD